MPGTFNDRQVQNNLEKTVPRMSDESIGGFLKPYRMSMQMAWFLLSLWDRVVVERRLTRALITQGHAMSLGPIDLHPIDVLYQILGEE